MLSRITARNAVTTGALACLAVLALHALGVGVGIGPGTTGAPFGVHLYLSIDIAAGLAVLAAARRRPGEHLAWTLLGCGLVLWGLGNVYMLFGPEAASPSPLDVFWLSFYPLSFTSLALLVRSRHGRVDPRLAVDALIAALSAGALVAVLVLPAVERSMSGGLAQKVMAFAYPMLDTLLVGAVVATFALAGWRPDRRWLLLAGGLALNAATDGILVQQYAAGTYLPGGLLDSGWPSAALLLALAAWHRPPARAARPAARAQMAMPAILGLVALGVLLWEPVRSGTPVARAFAALALAAAIGRMGLALRDNARALADRARLLAQTVRSAEQERVLVAAELHDGPIQHLASLSYVLDRAVRRLRDADADAALPHVERARLGLAAEIAGLRRLMAELRPPVLDEGGLQAALRDYAADFTRRHRVAVDVDADLDADALAPEIETVVYRVTQESLANVAKHAAAGAVQVRLRGTQEGIELAVDDDGCGFDVAALPDLAREGHFGLIGMRERVESVGGAWEVRSTPGEGTAVRVALPATPRQSTRGIIDRLVVS
ncbi:MAG: sensor histidine kinase [Actinomycetota bacterium]